MTTTKKTADALRTSPSWLWGEAFGRAEKATRALNRAELMGLPTDDLRRAEETAWDAEAVAAKAAGIPARRD